MKKHVFYAAIFICLISPLTYAQPFKENAEIQRRGTRGSDPRQQQEAIKKLESDGSQESINELLGFLTNDRMESRFRQSALTALGKIGTEPAIEAVKKFEAWSQKRYAEPSPFQMGLQFTPLLNPLAQTKDKDNKTWALISMRRYGGLDLWLTSLIENNNWSSPIFLSIPDFPGLSMSRSERENANTTLQVDGDVLKITYNNTTYETRISDQLKDTDTDGLPDSVETKLLTDVKNPDSDGDGIADGKDSNPLNVKHKESNDKIEIRQAAFSALFATASNQNTIIIINRGEFAKQEYYGFDGPVLKASESRQGFVNITSIDIIYQSEDSATVRINDYEGPMAGSMHEVKLKKINGKWIVVEILLRGAA